LDILNGNKYSDPYEQNKRLYNAYKSIGDEENAARFADVLVNREVDEAEKQKAVDEVKNAYDKKLELQRLESEQQLKRYRLYLWIAMLVIGLMVVLWGALRYRKKKEEETLKLQEAQHQLKDELEQQSSQQKKMLQQHVMTIYQTEQKDKLERITEAFESAYPKALEKMRSAYPNLNESECRVVMLSFLGFRAKETADILGLTENTAMKYRSNIRKKVGNDPISDLL
jgi:DNA-binding CsgD family transcriptional regulator